VKSSWAVKTTLSELKKDNSFYASLLTAEKFYGGIKKNYIPVLFIITVSSSVTFVNCNFVLPGTTANADFYKEKLWKYSEIKSVRKLTEKR